MSIQAELISIGNELLSGRTLNTHGQDLGASLSVIGLQLVRDTTVPDEVDAIADAIGDALIRVDLVFVSGGLGPTVDDITRDALSQLLGLKIVLDQPTVACLKAWYEQRDRQITLAATRQAQVLESAVVLPNSVGAAPGQRIELADDQILLVLPGPPAEFNAILSEEIVPWLKNKYTDARPNLIRIVCTRGIGESDIVTLLERENFEPSDIDLGFYPAKGRVEIRLTAKSGKDAEIADAERFLLKLLADHLDPDPM